LHRINGFRAARGGAPLLPLPEHAHLGGADLHALIARIGEFQSRVVAPNKTPDKCVDPGGATETALLRGLSEGFSALKLKLIIPNAHDSKVAVYAPRLDDMMDDYDIDTPLRQAHFLAQLAVESDRLKTAQEYKTGDEYEDRDDLGNTEDGDGRRFKGRGLIQLTGRNNYQDFGDYYGLSLTRLKDDANRQKLSHDPVFAVEVSCWFWQKHKLNIWADADNVLNVTKMINAGRINVKVASLHGYPERKYYALRAKAVMIPQHKL
jgi:putative chitinase